jgi:hypothetical protein
MGIECSTEPFHHWALRHDLEQPRVGQRPGVAAHAVIARLGSVSGTRRQIREAGGLILVTTDDRGVSTRLAANS